MKRVLLSLVVLGLAFFQAKAQSISYKVIEDDVKNLKPLTVNLYPFYADAYGVNITMGWQASAMLDLGRLSFQADYRRAYPKFDINYAVNVDNDLVVAKNGQKPFSRFEAVAQFNFSDRSLDRNLRVVLSSSSYTVGNTRYTNTKYISVPGTKRRKTGLRGGVYWMNTAIDFGDLRTVGEANQFPVYAVSKTDSKDTLKFGTYGDRVDGSSIYSGNSMNNVVSLFGGISFQSITNLYIRADGYGKRKNSAMSDIYIEGMFAPVIAVSDVVTKGGKVWNLEAREKTHWGWRFGWYYKAPSNKFGICYKSEFGVRPGLKGDALGRIFIDIAMGLDIPFKLVPSKKKS